MTQRLHFIFFTFMHWRRKWQPTPEFLPGESQGRGSLVGCHLWGRTESDMTEATQQQQQSSKKPEVGKISVKYVDTNKKHSTLYLPELSFMIITI